MKHGDKAKKSAKGKASGKTASRKVASPGKTKSGAKGGAKSSRPEATPKAAAPKAGSKPALAGNGKSNARNAPGVTGFSNPVVAGAFKRAVKKYPTAFRRLTD